MKLGILLNAFYTSIPNPHVRGRPLDPADPNLNLADQLTVAQEIGIKNVEIQAPLQHATPKQIQALKQALDAADVRAGSVHAPFPVYDEGAMDDISSPDEAVRDAAVATIAAAIDLVAPLQPDALVLHPCGARMGDGLQLDQDETRLQARTEACVESLVRLSEHSQAQAISLALENTLPGDLEKPDDLITIVDRVARPNVGLCLDTGHAMIAGVDPGETVHRMGSRLRHIHAHDNHGVVDEHLFPFLGDVPWRSLFDALHAVAFEGIFMLEVASINAAANRDQLAQLREMGSFME
jgi:sugar phosphate isomerase/epimerase